MPGLGLDLASLGGRRVFSPAALFRAGEVGLWYDPSDLASVFQDAAGAVAGAVDAPVGLIRDKSGRGNHATQPNDAQRPMLRQAADGRRYLDFDGADDRLGFATLTSDTGWALAAACEADALPAGGNIYDVSAPIIGGWQSGYAQDISIGLRNDATSSAASLYAENGSTGGEVRAGAVTVGARCVTLGESGAGGTRVRLNGGDWASGAGSRDDLRIEGVGQFGNSRWLDGRIYALVAIGRALGDAEADALARWLADKAGVAL
jgi:hypothetical protein